MTTNSDLIATWTYHNDTKHSQHSIRSSRHSLDWDNQPLAFKIYSSLDPLPLPQDFPPVSLPALTAIAATGETPETESLPTLPMLATLLFLSAGITKRRTYPRGEIYFRAAACTGALYHIDLYLVCGELPGLPAGVYHFGPHDFSLRRVRTGDYRGVLAEATGNEHAVLHAPLSIMCTSTYWRNAWKYQARAYRHCFWDAGTLIANFLAAAAGLHFPTQVVGGFVDATVNQLLDLDTDREAALAILPIGWTEHLATTPAPPIAPLALPTVPLSPSEVEYPAMRAMHAASSLTTEADVVTWRGAPLPTPEATASGQLFPLTPLDDSGVLSLSLDHVIRHRGSSRAFARQPISFAQLSAIVQSSTRGIAADFLQPVGTTLIDLYLIVNAVEGIPAGTYVFRRHLNALELLRAGNFRREAGHLGLGQDLPADASVAIFCLANLPPTLERFGNRGYRAAQLEAAIIGGKCYLAAYGQRLGASGLTFFDDEVTTFFSPSATGKSVMFLTAIGIPAKQRIGTSA
jgi:SagB-type dehydrogenase family enzyme